MLVGKQYSRRLKSPEQFQHLSCKMESFLDTAGAFVIPVKGKTNTPVVYLPTREKSYTKSGLRKILHEPDVQEDVIKMIRNMEAPE